MEGSIMKKLFFASLVAVLFLGVTNVSAMTESELRKRFDETVTVGKTTFAVADGDKKAVDDYLAKYEVSEKDCSYISDKIDEAIKIVKSEGKENFKDYSANAKTKLKKLVTDIAANTSVKATVTNGSMVVLNNDGSTFYEVDHLVKQTGTQSDNIAIIATISFVVSIVGACLVVRQVKHN